MACALASAAGAQGDPVSRAKELYQLGEYLAVVDLVEASLSDTLGLDRADIVTLRNLGGCAYVALGNLDSAKNQFKRMLELDSEVKMDPLTTSPKILSVFEEARREYEAEHRIRPPSDSLGPVAPQRYLRTDVWVVPAVKSLLIPGLGQLDNGEQAKAIVFISAEALSLAGLAVSQVWYEDARREYSANTNPAMMDRLYEEYNRWYMMRNGFIATSAGICLASSVDAIVGAFRAEIRGNGTRVGFVPLRGGGLVCITF